MELVPGGVDLTFEVTFDSNSLNVGMSVYDTTGPSPILEQGPSAMTNVVGATYIGKFNPTTGHSYLIFKAVYTDNTFETLSPNYLAGSESIYADEFSGGGGSSGGGAVVGFVIPDETVIGIVQC